MIPALLWTACGPPPPPIETQEAPPPSPAPLSEAAPELPSAIYFVLMDRFADGREDPPGATDPDDLHAWHGGDLAGLIQRLPQLAELGVDALWLSPLSRSRQETFGGWGASHGYWVEELGALDSRWGEVSELETLRARSQELGLGLFLDLVYNHAAPDGELRQQRPEWFHPPMPIEDWSDPIQAVQGEVHGLPDLNQSHPEVFDYLEQGTRWWLERLEPQGIRVDALRHLNPDFLPALREALEPEGRDLLWLGEIFEGDPMKFQREAEQAGLWEPTGMVFDYPLHYAMMDSLCGEAPAGRLAAALSMDRSYPRREGLVTFLDNHDRPRLLSACGEDLERARRAVEFWLTLRGIPCITYGTERPLSGAEEPENRKDMPWEEELLLAETLREGLQRRHEWEALTTGRDWPLLLEEERFVYLRWLPEEPAVLISLNLGEQPGVLALPDWLGPAGETLLGPQAPSPDGRGLLLPPGVGVTVFPEATAPPARGEQVTALRALGVPALQPGESLRLVGAGPELGHWDPQRGLVLQDGAGELSWSGAPWVAQGKLVLLSESGEARWSSGQDATALLRDGESWTLRWED